MAVYGETISLPGLTAGANLTTHQYKWVKAASTAGQVLVANATTDNALGILQNDPNTGEAAYVVSLGVSKMIAGVNDLAVADRIGWNTTGQGVDHTTDNRRIGAVALEASTAIGDIVRVLVRGLSRF